MEEEKRAIEKTHGFGHHQHNSAAQKNSKHKNII
jgi:hypothetical protein